MSFHFLCQQFFHSLPGRLFITSRLYFIAYPLRCHSYSGAFHYLLGSISFLAWLLFHSFPAAISLLIHCVFIPSREPFSLFSGSYFIPCLVAFSLVSGSHFIAYPLRFHFFSGAFFIASRLPFHIYFIMSPPHFHCFPAPVSLLIRCVFIPSLGAFSLLPDSHFIVSPPLFHYIFHSFPAHISFISATNLIHNII